MKILVAGGAVFVGSNLVGHFQGQTEMCLLNNLRSGHKHDLNGRNTVSGFQQSRRGTAQASH